MKGILNIEENLVMSPRNRRPVAADKPICQEKVKNKHHENREKTEGQIFLLISGQKYPFTSMQVSAWNRTVTEYLKHLPPWCCSTEGRAPRSYRLLMYEITNHSCTLALGADDRYNQGQPYDSENSIFRLSNLQMCSKVLQVFLTEIQNPSLSLLNEKT